MNNIELLYQKLLKELDYDFLNQIKEYFPYKHVYFLTCLVEVIWATLDNEKEYKRLEKLELIDLLKFYIDKAKRLYDSSDISEELLVLMEDIN